MGGRITSVQNSSAFKKAQEPGEDPLKMTMARRCPDEVKSAQSEDTIAYEYTNILYSPVIHRIFTGPKKVNGPR